MDFAGGAVVHINAGVAALVAALVMGSRRGFPETPMPPHNLPATVTGACMLWVGWFGFNAGSALAANGSAGMAMLVTHVGAAAGSLAWMAQEWFRFGKPSVLGIVTGMVAGLGTITPASGYVGPGGALVIGLLAGVVCFWATQFIKRRLQIDDSLDVFPVHGVGGILGILLTAIFAVGRARRLQRPGPGGRPDVIAQLGVQALGAVATIGLVWLGQPSLILKVLGCTSRRCGSPATRKPRAWTSCCTRSAATTFDPVPANRPAGTPRPICYPDGLADAAARGDAFRRASPAHRKPSPEAASQHYQP